MARESELVPSAGPGQRRPEEVLTEQFYAWERRGRGWRVWDHAVELEPAFVPFRYHWIPRARGVADDGQRPTFLSRLTDSMLGTGSADQGPAEQAGLPVLELEDSEPVEDTSEVALAELRLSLPADGDVSPEEMEQFLLALPSPDYS